ncbi:MAG TPA: Rieske 2Fe-2S domain-containing protein [Polyangiaceae bacterium]|nr:Rieske 2Fe-2S domain-containing protein [Polyangiaceae bacterium]
MTFTRVLPDAELWTGEMRGLVVGGRRVLLVRTEHAVCAYEDRCAHLGVPLSTGRLENGVITCAVHQYQYDARTGRGINPENVALRALPVCLLGADIAVDVESAR